MRKTNLLLSCIMLSYFVYAQDKTVKDLQKDAATTIKKDLADTIPRIWRKGGWYNLNLSQGSLSNWAEGGDDFSLSLNSNLSLFAFYKKGRYSWDNTLDFNLGYMKTTTLGSRKNEDRLDVLSKYEYAISKHLNIAGLFNFRTQLFKGYSYTNNSKTLSSNFLSPAYILLSLGLDYKPTEHLSIFVSPLTSRWVIVKDDSLSARGLYGVAPGKKSVNELGAFVTINYLKDINKNITYKGRMDLFSNYKHNPQNVDLFMTNVFSLKLSKVLSANWNLDFIYDDDARLFGKNKTSPALQVKSVIGLGLLVKF